MYVQDMDLDEVYEWADELERRVRHTRPGSAAREQALFDLEDIHHRMMELEA